MKKLVLIDSNAIIHRAYHALPKSLSTRKGEMTNSVYGFAITLIKVLQDLKPDYIVASFDVAKKTFRHKEFAEYKAKRIKADQELYDQIPRVKQLLEAFNIPIYEKEGYEADDVIGTITSKIRNPKSEILNKSKIKNSNIQNNITIYIVTGDKDLFQLVDGNIYVYLLKKGLKDIQIVDRKKIKEEYDLDPEDFIDLKALAGDPSDNIPGVPGVGPKTAIALLQQFDTLNNLYDKIGSSLEKVGLISKSEFLISNQIPNPNDEILKQISEEYKIKPRILKLLIENKEQAFLSQKLATIKLDVPVKFSLEDCRWGDYDKDEAKRFMEELNFQSLLKRFGGEEKEEPKTKKTKEQKKKDKQLKLL